MATRALQQVLTYIAWNTSTNVYVTGDVANHTVSWEKDGTRAATTNGAAEVDSVNLPGLYKVTMTSTETDCIEGVLGGKSSTANVILVPTMASFNYLNTSAPVTAGIPDVNVQTIAGNSTAASNVSRANRDIVRGTCSGGSTTTAVCSSITTPATLTDVGQLIGRTIIFDSDTVSANLQGQASNITNSTTGATPTITFTTMTHAPANGDTFVIL
jgi:hypothetical protein